MKPLQRALGVGFGLYLVGVPVNILTAQEKDPLVGTWTLNLSKSTYAGQPPKSQTRTYEDLGGGLLSFRNETVDAKGDRTVNRIVFRRDGREYPIADQRGGNRTFASNVKSTNPWVSEYITKADGKVTATVTETVSRDGRTVTGKGTNVQVWDRQ